MKSRELRVDNVMGETINHYECMRRLMPEGYRAEEKKLRQLRGKDGLIDLPSFRVKSGEPSIVEEAREVYCLYFDRGRQNFRVGPVLEEMLANTRVMNVPKEMLKFPFDAFYIELEGSSRTVYDGEGENHPLRGVYVISGWRGEPDCMKVVYWGSSNTSYPKRSEGLRDGVNWFTVNLKDCQRRQSGGLMLESYFSALIEDDSLLSLTGEEVVPIGELRKNVNATLVYVLRLIINTVLYINSQNPESTLIKKPRVAVPRRLQNKFPQCGAVTIKLGRSLESSKMRRVFLSGDASYKRRHYRVGHWREVWVGKRTNENGEKVRGTHRELRWVHPTIVNRHSDNEVPRTTYILPAEV